MKRLRAAGAESPLLACPGNLRRHHEIRCAAVGRAKLSLDRGERQLDPTRILRARVRRPSDLLAELACAGIGPRRAYVHFHRIPVELDLPRAGRDIRGDLGVKAEEPASASI